MSDECAASLSARHRYAQQEFSVMYACCPCLMPIRNDCLALRIILSAQRGHADGLTQPRRLGSLRDAL